MLVFLCPLQVRLVVEVVWPLFLFFILVWVRSTNHPIYKGQCKSIRNASQPLPSVFASKPPSQRPRRLASIYS